MRPFQEIRPRLLRRRPSSAIRPPTVYPTGNRIPYQMGTPKKAAPATWKPTAAPAAATAKPSATQPPGEPCMQFAASAKGRTTTHQLKRKAAVAVASVDRAPPNMSITFLAKPGQSVLHPEYIRLEIWREPSIIRTVNPDRFNSLPSSRSSQIAPATAA